MINFSLNGLKSVAAVAALVGFFGTVGAAQALTVSATPIADFATVDLTSTVTVPNADVSGLSIRGGSIGSTYRSPFDGSGIASAPTNWRELPYFSVGPSTSSPQFMMLNSTSTWLSLLIGSVDAYNTIKFFLGGSQVGSVSGNQILAAGAETGGIGANSVYISGVSTFDKVGFYSTNNAFEFSNIAVAPIPPAMLLIGTGLVGLGIVGRRKKAKKDALAAA